MTSPSSISGNTGSGAAEPSLTDKVAQQAQSLAQQTQQKAGDLVDQAQDQAKAGLSRGKERAAGSIGAVAQALRQTSQQLRQQHQEGIAGFADTAAGQVEQIAGYLRDRDIDQFAREAENLARSQPAMFLGGAMALGFLAARFFKSSRADEGRAAAYPTAAQRTVPTYDPMNTPASSPDRPYASGTVTSHG